MVTGLLLIDLILLMTWQLYDPMQRTMEEFPLEDPLSLDDDIKIRPELEHCKSENNTVWLGKQRLKSKPKGCVWISLECHSAADAFSQWLA